MQCLFLYRCGVFAGNVLPHEIFDRIAGPTPVPLAALCDKVATLNA
jgi:hypothetical protein